MKYLLITMAAGLFVSCNSKDGKSHSIHKANMDSLVSASYIMRYNIEPAKPVAGMPVKITLKPTKINSDTIVPLEVQHERKIHLIVVSEDLSLFKHLHPVEQKEGSYLLSNTFLQGGRYLLYADYKPVNAEKQVTMQQVSVSGNLRETKTYPAQFLQSETNRYQVWLQTNDSFITSNKEMMFTAKISIAGDLVSPDKLENYLGEKAHMVIIGIADKTYLHVHPMVMGRELMLHTTFPAAGLYRAWLEFKKDGIVNVADFVINVSGTNVDPSSNNPGGHNH